MSTINYSSGEDVQRYDRWICHHPHGSLWQSLEWKRYQEALGRETQIYIDEDQGSIRSSALVIIDRTTGGLSTWDIPRGPLWRAGVDNQEVEGLIQHIIADAKKGQVMSLSLSPQNKLTAYGLPLTASKRHIYPEATILIDLRASEEEILAQMHQKGRYNIRLAEKKGVTIEQTRDIYSFYTLTEETGRRDGFQPPSLKTYEAFLNALPGSFLLLAYADHRPVAGLIGVTWNNTGIYYYGASSHEHRTLQAPSLLQWEAMKLCKRLGCHTYDLFGIAPPNTTNHPWEGVTDFKRKFGRTVVTYPPEQRIILRQWMARALALKRKFFG